MNKIQSLLFKALRNRFEAERDEASATLEIYFSNPVGIGEHPQIVDEMAKQIEKLANAEDKLNTLTKEYRELFN
jgi:hypothetical protein